MGFERGLSYHQLITYSIMAVVCALGTALLAQQSSRDAGVWTIDSSGHRVEGPRYTSSESPAGGQRVETARSINGRLVPVEASEDRVLSQSAQGKVVERTIRKYDADGAPGPPLKVRIEETRNTDGSATIRSTSFQSDLNGNLQPFERSTTEVRKGAATETSVTVERATLNGALETVERTRSVEKPASDGSQFESTTYRRDVSGNFSAFAQDTRRTTKKGAEETTDAAHYELGSDGKVGLVSRAIERVRTNPDGSQVADADVYSKYSAGRTGDPNASEPRLQEQSHRELTKGPGGVTTEVTTVRARMPNDPSRFGPYEKTSQVTYTSTDAMGREVKSTETTVGRRDANGQVLAQEGRSERSVSTSTKK